jgi:hypothetical protein
MFPHGNFDCFFDLWVIDVNHLFFFYQVPKPTVFCFKVFSFNWALVLVPDLVCSRSSCDRTGRRLFTELLIGKDYQNSHLILHLEGYSGSQLIHARVQFLFALLWIAGQSTDEQRMVQPRGADVRGWGKNGWGNMCKTRVRARTATVLKRNAVVDCNRPAKEDVFKGSLL